MKEDLETYKYLDFATLWLYIKKRKMLYIICLSVALLFSILYASGMEELYESQVKLSPEFANMYRKGYTNANNILFTSEFRNFDARTMSLYPEIYPDLMNSVDFKASLLTIQINPGGGSKSLSYYDYLLNYQPIPWWMRIFINPEYETPDTLNPFLLSFSQARIIKVANSYINCIVDDKSQAIIITVKDQDAFVSAQLADSVTNRLRLYLINSLTRKAKSNLDYHEQIASQAKHEYNNAVNDYLRFADSNRELNSPIAKSKLDELENEKDLQYNLYGNAVTMYTQAETKFYEERPVFAVIQSATVPLTLSHSERIKYVFFVIMICFSGLSFYSIIRERHYMSRLSKIFDRTVYNSYKLGQKSVENHK